LILEPSNDGVDIGFWSSDQISKARGAKVLTISSIFWVRDSPESLLELVEVSLLESKDEVNGSLGLSDGK